MKNIHYLPIILFMCLFLEAIAAVEEFEALTYAKYGDRELQLDLFRPKEQAGPLPAIIWIHGGGWKNGTRKGGAKMARYFAERNYVAIPI